MVFISLQFHFYSKQIFMIISCITNLRGMRIFLFYSLSYHIILLLLGQTQKIVKNKAIFGFLPNVNLKNLQLGEIEKCTVGRNPNI